jgi:hypothetical protein
MKNYKISIISIITIVITLAVSVRLKAQHLEITPYAGYETGGKVSTSSGYLRVDDGMNFGGAISFGYDATAQLEFSYNHMNSELSLDVGESITNRTPVNVDYYMFGVTGSQWLGDRFMPFYGGALGWVHYGTPSENYGNESLFAINIQGGLKILLTDWLGFRMQARLLMPLYYTGAYFEAGTSGAGYGITSTCFMVQGDFTGALYFIIE